MALCGTGEGSVEEAGPAANVCDRGIGSAAVSFTSTLWTAVADGLSDFAVPAVLIVGGGARFLSNHCTEELLLYDDLDAASDTKFLQFHKTIESLQGYEKNGGGDGS